MGSVEYIEVDASAVPYRIRRLAEATLAAVCRRLKLRQSVTIRWFTEPYGLREPGRASFWADRPIGGCVRRGYPETIWLRATMPADAVIENVAHECRHLYQHEHHGDIFHADAERQAWCEADATLYASEVRGWLD